MTGFMVYTWQGEPILDIEQWARDRGECIVDTVRTIRHNTQVPDTTTAMNRLRWRLACSWKWWHVGNPPLRTEVVEETWTESIPDSFYHSARLQNMDESDVVSVKRRRP